MSALDKIKSIQALLNVEQDGAFGANSRTALDQLISDARTGFESVAPPLVLPPDESGLIFNHWPKEADAAAFFRYPPNLTQIDVEYPMHMDAVKISRITCNILVAPSLRRIFAAILKHYNGDMAKLSADGMDAYDGCYNDRSIRGSSRRSMHAYGAAIDIDAEHNPLGAEHWRMPSAVVAIFTAEGWRWGGLYHGRKDAQHFEACV